MTAIAMTTAASHREGSPSCLDVALGDREFERLRTLIEREAGIHLGLAKRALVMGRLGKHLRVLGLRSFREYCDRVEKDPVERLELLDRISTNVTQFFREPRHFELLAREILPRWRAEADQGHRSRSIKVWSSACSTGEEPYTLAMVLLGAFPPGSGWELDILASDISARVLCQAREAVWRIDKACEIPEDHLKRFMLKGVGAQEGMMRASPELRDIVRYARINLVEPHTGLGTMDLIFCRNVLIYFDAPTKRAVISQLLEHLAPDGYLFLGHAEGLANASHGLRCVAPSVYTRAPKLAHGRHR